MFLVVQMYLVVQHLLIKKYLVYHVLPECRPFLSDVGIGTTVPSAKLDVNVGSSVTAFNVEGSEGQLFSITNNLSSGSIFAVNDITGLPSVDVNADGTIQLAPRGAGELVGIGTTVPTSKLHVVGDTLVTGIVTANAGVFIPDNQKLQVGNVAGTADFEIAHDTNNTVLQNRTGDCTLKVLMLLVMQFICNLRIMKVVQYFIQMEKLNYIMITLLNLPHQE